MARREAREKKLRIGCILALAAPAPRQAELSKNKCENKKIEVWQRGVDTWQFNPRFRDAEMRKQLCDGHPE